MGTLLSHSDEKERRRCYRWSGWPWVTVVVFLGCSLNVCLCFLWNAFMFISPGLRSNYRHKTGSGPQMFSALKQQEQIPWGRSLIILVGGSFGSTTNVRCELLQYGRFWPCQHVNMSTCQHVTARHKPSGLVFVFVCGWVWGFRVRVSLSGLWCLLLPSDLVIDRFDPWLLTFEGKWKVVERERLQKGVTALLGCEGSCRQAKHAKEVVALIQCCFIRCSGSKLQCFCFSI